MSDLDTDQREAMQKQLIELKKELGELYPMIEDNSSLHDRLKKTGKLSRNDAQRFGALGYVGRASGCTLDLRHDAAYPPYDKFNVHVVFSLLV